LWAIINRRFCCRHYFLGQSGFRIHPDPLVFRWCVRLDMSLHGIVHLVRLLDLCFHVLHSLLFRSLVLPDIRHPYPRLQDLSSWQDSPVLATATDTMNRVSAFVVLIIISKSETIIKMLPLRKGTNIYHLLGAKSKYLSSYFFNGQTVVCVKGTTK
jgi:hypothetical protein